MTPIPNPETPTPDPETPLPDPESSIWIPLPESKADVSTYEKDLTFRNEVA